MSKRAIIPVLGVTAASILAMATLCVGTAQQNVETIKAKVRLVELHATVLDNHGRYLDGLTPDRFEIRDNGELCQVFSFEPIAAEFSCAIVMDRTGSVQNALPAIKNSITRFIDAFRDGDWIAVYNFNITLRKAQEFTQDKGAAKKAVLRVIAGGATALFDSISTVSRDLSTRLGKKAIVAFTDGQDNSSLLSPSVVVRQAKSLGIPLYFVAQGDALKDQALVQVLEEISRATAGEVYTVEKPSGINRVFQSISKDLRHSYMLTYAPPPTADSRWRTIKLSIKGVDNARIRVREGYFPD